MAQKHLTWNDVKLRILLIHADHFEYETREKAISNPEEISDADRQRTFENVLAAFSTVEKSDANNEPVIAQNAARAIAEMAQQVRPSKIVVYPYAHLSSNLGSRDMAINLLKQTEIRLQEQGYDVARSPFGWYKSFTISCKGHPLSELSRTISSETAKTEQHAVQSEYVVLDESGKLHDPREWATSAEPSDFKTLVEKEALKMESGGGHPHFLEYCKKFSLEWEPYSDLGHMRYGPEASLLFALTSDYAWKVASSMGIPVFEVRGTNTFDLARDPIRQHAELYGGRLYQIDIDTKSFVLRYAACHQQFSMLKDWAISYKHLPFGTFEVADSYRLEQSGELLLCFRTRKMHMPDLHVYCKDVEEAKSASFILHKKIYEEITKLGRDYASIYNTTRSFYEANKEFFRDFINVERKPVLLNFVPEGHYYWVLNVEYNIIDELNRPREIGTVQIDVGNAKRFGISYTDKDGEKKYPPILHSALIGTVERFIFSVLDTAVKTQKNKGVPSLPVWLSPVQVRVVPVGDHFVEDATRLALELTSSQVRADVDDRPESVPRRIRDAETSWIPHIIVYGEEERRSRMLKVRRREKSDTITMSLKELIDEIHAKTNGYPYRALQMPLLLSQRPIYKSV